MIQGSGSGGEWEFESESGQKKAGARVRKQESDAENVRKTRTKPIRPRTFKLETLKRQTSRPPNLPATWLTLNLLFFGRPYAAPKHNPIHISLNCEEKFKVVGLREFTARRQPRDTTPNKVVSRKPVED